MQAHAQLWYVKDGESSPIGPMTTELLVQGLRAGRVALTVHVCPVGGAEWMALSAHPLLASVVREVAPPPPMNSAPRLVSPRSPSTAAYVGWAAGFVMIVAIVLVVAKRSIEPTSTVPASTGACSELRTCCDDLERVLTPDPNRRAMCTEWTEPGTDARHQGTCAYGTDCWCGRMLNSFHSKGLCK